MKEIKRLKRDCAEAYQILGAIAEGVRYTVLDLTRALDNLSAAAEGEKRPHDDLLPWPRPSSRKEYVIARMKAEILEDMKAGRIPIDTKSFGQLHDYVDANCYGGFCEDEVADEMIAHFGGRDADEGMPQGMLDFINEVQEDIDAWLKASAAPHEPKAVTRDVELSGFRDKLVGFDFQGTWITDPYLSECGRFVVDPSYYGFTTYHTGGGCMALIKEFSDGSYILITSDDANIPQPTDTPDQICFGFYADGEDEDPQHNLRSDAIKQREEDQK